MGYVLGVSRCHGCGYVISYNPLRVPSVMVNGKREPLCRDCVRVANRLREQNGLDLIVPHRDAYDAVDENELP